MVVNMPVGARRSGLIGGDVRGYGGAETATMLAASGSPLINSVAAGVIVFVVTRVLDRVFFGRK